MCQDDEDAHLVISVLDKLDGDVLKRHAGYHNEAELKTFLHEDKRDGVKMRLILAEQQGPSLASGVMEALGASPKLDPRFFQWSIRDDIHLWSPSERQRAPFGSIGFMVTKERTQEMTDIDVFHVLIYVQPDAVDDGWTGEDRLLIFVERNIQVQVPGLYVGVLLFHSYTKISMSVHTPATPQYFSLRWTKGCPRWPSANLIRSKNCYLSKFDFNDIKKAAVLLFHCIHPLLRLNSYC